MTTGRLKAAVAVILSALCVFSCFSCNKRADNSNVLEALASMKEQGLTDENDAKATDYYRIVIPSDCTATLALLAKDMARGIEERTGIDCGVVYDVEDFPYVEGAIEIILGNADRDAAALAFEDLKTGDYVCRFVGGSLCIGGPSEEATLTAARRFVDEILPGATAARIMETDGGFEHIGEYGLDTVLLCGFDIGDYSLAHSGHEEFAKHIRKTVADACGTYLEISDDECVKGKKEIVIATDVSSRGTAYIRMNNEDVIIGSADTYGLSFAVAKFCALLLSDAEDGRASFDVGEHNYACPNVAMSLTHVVSGIGIAESELDNIIALSDKINSIMSDVIIFGEISADTFTMVSSRLSSELAVIRQNGYAPIVYRKARVTPVSVTSGTIGGLDICQVEFLHIASNQKYTVICFASDGSANSVSAARDKLLGMENTVAVFNCPVTDGRTPDFSGMTENILHGGLFTVDGKVYYLSSMISDDRLLGTYEEPSSDGDSCFATLSVCVRYSDEYLKAIASENGVE